MKKLFSFTLVIVLIYTFLIPIHAQEADTTKKLSAGTFSGLKFRSIGPAFMSGRIADIAIHPENKNRWYIAVGSGGV